MLTTIPVPFDHHANRGGRVSFAEWAADSTAPGFSCEPIFRYGRTFLDAIAELRLLSASRRSLYLCNIVGHSCALTSKTHPDTDATLALEYRDINALIDTPKVIGHFVDDSLVADALSSLHDWQVVCGEHSFDESPLEAGLTEVGLVPAPIAGPYTEGVFLCRLTDPLKFAANRILIDFQAYFVPPSTRLDLAIVAGRYRREKLAEYLLRTGVTFGTLGDCHMDDDIAVSYLSPVFDFPAAHRCFIR